MHTSGSSDAQRGSRLTCRTHCTENQLLMSDAFKPVAIEHHIGSMVRRLRLANSLTINEVSERTGISGSMLSRIENAATASSVETLAKLAAALGVTMATLFRDYDLAQSDANLVKRDDASVVVKRGTTLGYVYRLLASYNGPNRTFESFSVTLDKNAEVGKPSQHSGTDFLYVLAGKFEFQHGETVFTLEPGDSMAYAAEVPHGPQKLLETPVTFLSVTMYQNEVPVA